MRILLLSHRIPYPPDKGDKIRSFHLLEALARKHEVSLITHADDPRDLAHVDMLARRCRSVRVYPSTPAARAARAAFALLRNRPLSFARFHDAAAAREVRRALRDEAPDAVVVFSAQPAEYLPERPGVPVVVDLVDVDSEKWAGYARSARGPMRFAYRREHRLVAAFERRLVARGFRMCVVSEREAAVFRRVVADVPVAVIPNGVAIPGAGAEGPRTRGRLIFVGAMDYAANEEAAVVAAEDVLPLVRRRLPDAHLRIVGRNPGRHVRALARLPGVVVTGEVPSAGAELDAADVSLLPLRTVRGVPNKVLEAFAHGVPVVSTPDALDAVGATPGEHGLASDAPEGLAQAAIRLVEDRELNARIGDAGRSLARTHFRWERFEEQVLDLVEGAARRPAP